MEFRHLPPAAIALLATALCSSAIATSPRVAALGGLADAFEDDSNVLRWPGSLDDYANLAVADLGTWNLDAGTAPARRGGAAHLRLDRDGRWGTVGFHFAEELPEAEPGGYFAAIYARSFGTLTAAVSFRGTTYGSARNQVGEGAFTGNTNYLHDWGAGVRIDATDDLYLDLVGELVHSELEFDDDARSIRIHETSHQGYRLRARAFQRVNERVALVPHVSYDRDERPTFAEPLDDVADLTAWKVLAGAGVNLLLDADNLVIISAEYLDHERDWRGRHGDTSPFASGTRDLWFATVRVGIESRLLPWLTLRAGAAYRRVTDEWYLRQESYASVSDYAYRWDVTVDAPVTLGAGVHLGSFDCDIVVNDSSPLASAQLPGGVEDFVDANHASITLSYRF